MTTDSGESPSHEVERSASVGLGATASVAVGTIVASVLALVHQNPVDIAAPSIITAAAGCLGAVWYRFQTSADNRRRHKEIQRIEIIEWLGGLIEMLKTNEEYWDQYQGRENVWRADLDRVATTMAKLGDRRSVLAFARLRGNLLRAYSFPIEPNERKEFKQGLLDLAEEVVRVIEEPGGRELTR